SRAVDFCNDTVWGSLNCALIVHPKSLQDPRVAEAVERAVASLRFGAVAVNHWPAIAYALVTPTWGAFPGPHRLAIRSGSGVVHNTFMFDRPQKTVVRGPFRVQPTPPWFVNHKTAAEIGRRLTDFESDPNPLKLPAIFWAALRG